MKSKKNVVEREPPAPPGHLSARSQELWRELHDELEDNRGREVLFIQALESLDRADVARAQIAAEGPVLTTSGKMAHAHPAVKIESEARREFLKLWKTLGLHRKWSF
jgi:phage terminase small subunit